MSAQFAFAGGEESPQIRRLLYEVRSLWGRVRKAERGRTAKVYLGSNQSISNDTPTKVELDTVDFDPFSLFDSSNNQIVLDRPGMWHLAALVRFATSSTGDKRRCQIEADSSVESVTQIGPSGATLSVPGSAIVKASGSDTRAELEALQDSGGSLSVVSGSPWTYLAATFLGSA